MKNYPVIEQKDCPQGLMSWMDKRLQDSEKRLIDHIDKRTEPVIKTGRMAIDNRMYIRLIAVAMLLIFVIALTG